MFTGEFDSTPSPDTQLILPSGIRVDGVSEWVDKIRAVTQLKLDRLGTTLQTGHDRMINKLAADTKVIVLPAGSNFLLSDQLIGASSK